MWTNHQYRYQMGFFLIVIETNIKILPNILLLSPVQRSQCPVRVFNVTTPTTPPDYNNQTDKLFLKSSTKSGQLPAVRTHSGT